MRRVCPYHSSPTRERLKGRVPAQPAAAPIEAAAGPPAAPIQRVPSPPDEATTGTEGIAVHDYNQEVTDAWNRLIGDSHD